jgi:hypothetical protein
MIPEIRKNEDTTTQRKLYHQYLDQILELRLKGFYQPPDWYMEFKVPESRLKEEDAKYYKARSNYSKSVELLDELYQAISGINLNEDTDA